MYFCEIYPTCVSSKLCEFIMKARENLFYWFVAHAQSNRQLRLRRQLALLLQKQSAHPSCVGTASAKWEQGWLWRYTWGKIRWSQIFSQDCECKCITGSLCRPSEFKHMLLQLCWRSNQQIDHSMFNCCLPSDGFFTLPEAIVFGFNFKSSGGWHLGTCRKFVWIAFSCAWTALPSQYL